jgi:DNA-binding transcriptional LysR family regulator
VEIAANERLVDLAVEGFDAGVRLGQFVAADMIAVPITPPIALAVVGSPDYLERHRRPERIEDLRQHACLRIRRTNGSIGPWRFMDGNKAVEAVVSGPLIAHDYPALLGGRCPRSGLGASAWTDCGVTREGWPPGARLGRFCAHCARHVPLLRRSPPNHADAARFHRSCEEPLQNNR